MLQSPGVKLLLVIATSSPLVTPRGPAGHAGPVLSPISGTGVRECVRGGNAAARCEGHGGRRWCCAQRGPRASSRRDPASRSAQGSTNTHHLQPAAAPSSRKRAGLMGRAGVAGRSLPTWNTASCPGIGLRINLQRDGPEKGAVQGFVDTQGHPRRLRCDAHQHCHLEGACPRPAMATAQHRGGQGCVG